jgi:Dynamin family
MYNSHIPAPSLSVSADRARSALSECAALLPPNDPFARTLRVAADRLDQPMRLAVVGQIKRGKSSLVNALLGMDVLRTDRPEVTFNVNELYHSDTVEVTVEFREGSPPEKISLEQLGYWTNYDQGNLADLRRVQKVMFGLPNELLRNFRLVDTPGLGSIHMADSAATFEALGVGLEEETADLRPRLELLGREASTVHQESFSELEQADAVLYLVSRGVHEKDRDVLSALSGGTQESLTPLKAFGVLSKCDDYWPPDQDQLDAADPLVYHPLRDGARRVAEKLQEDPQLSRLFYTVIPVAARVAVGAAVLDASQLGWLETLARREPRWLASRLSDQGAFAEDAALGLPRAARTLLLDRLGPWGIHVACGAIRDGLSDAALREHMRTESGVTQLQDVIVRHFGNRAALIKVSQAVRSVRRGLPDCRRRQPEASEEIGRKVEALERSEHGFAELAALSAHYRGALTDFRPDEVDQLLQITGERGPDCARRLGLSPDASLLLMAGTALERIRYWTKRTNDPRLERDSQQAARTLLRGYEQIAHRIRLAMAYLEMAE